MTTRIGFSTTRGPVSWVIRKLTRSQVSHVFFLYWDHDWQMDMVLEAADSGFRVVPFDRFQTSNVVVKVMEPAVDIEDGLRWVARAYLGTVYDWGGLAGMLLVLLGWARNPLHSRKAVFCSKAVVHAFQHSVGYPGAPQLVASKTSPRKLLRFMEAS